MNQENKIAELEARIDKLEHALLVAISWDSGKAEYVRAIINAKQNKSQKLTVDPFFVEAK